MHMADPSTDVRTARQVPWDTLPAWVLAALGTLVCLVLYLPVATWDYDQVTDTRATAIAAWSLADHGSIQVDTTWPDVPWAEEGPDGNHYVWRHPGGIVWSTLFYLPTNLGLSPSSALEVPYGPATVSAVVATALGVGVMILVFRRLVPARTALFAGLALGLATPNWSISADAAWNHGPTLLFLGLGLLASSHDRHGWSGLSMAAAITVRPHLAVAPAVLGLAEGWRQRRLGPVIAMAATSLLGLLAVVWFYNHFFGEPTMRPDQTAAFVSGDVNLTDHGWVMNTLLALGSPTRGLFFYAPFLLLLLPGIPAAWRGAPTWVRASAVSGLLYLGITTRADVFHAGHGFFGYRGLLELVTLAAPLLVLVYERYVRDRPRLRVATEVTTMACVVVFAIGSSGTPFLAREPAHCWIERYVAPYRPLEERVEFVRSALVVCEGLPPDEAEAIIQEQMPSEG